MNELTGGMMVLLVGLGAAFAADVSPHAEDLAVMKEVVALNPAAVEAIGAGAMEGPALGWRDAENDRRRLSVTWDEQGRITALRGNGPWLPNAALELLVRLPELRDIYLDHNLPPKGDPRPREDFDGSGFRALASGKLEKVMIGHAMTDAGALALAAIPTLEDVHIEHANWVTGEGIRGFANHPRLERFAWGAHVRSDEAAFFGTATTLPRLRELVFKDTIATYDGGLRLLRPLRGKLEVLDLRKTLALPADLERFRADHPEAKLLTISEADLASQAAKQRRRMSPELAAWVDAQLSPAP